MVRLETLFRALLDAPDRGISLNRNEVYTLGDLWNGLSCVMVTEPSDDVQDRTCTTREVVRSGHFTTVRAVKKN
jgi:hypothetical protein